MINALTLWVPGLLNRLRVKEAQEALRQLKLPALQTIIAKSDRFPVKPQSFYEQASYLFHQPESLPVAATEAQLFFKESQQSALKDFWLKVDPVQMIADRDSLVLISAKHLAISKQESQELIEAFNAHFAQDGVELFWAASNSWFLTIKQPVDIQTAELELVDHKPVNEFYPKGNAAQYWRQLINETQMLFYTHAVNEQRREKGWPEINSVWAWGEGQICPSMIKHRPDSIIWSSHSYLQGMAELTKTGCEQSPESFKNFETSLSSLTARKDLQNHFILLDEIYENMDQFQIDDWIEILQKLEQDWFAPLLESVKKGRLNSLLLDLGCDYRCHLQPSHMRRFWRLKKGLDRL